MIMSALLVLCFAILLMAAFSQKTTKNYSTNEGGCVWNCTIFDSTFGKKVKASITDEQVVSYLYVKNPISIDKHCANQTKSKEPSQLWIWQTDDSESESSVIVVGERFSWVVWTKNSLKEQIEARISCTLQRPSISASHLRRISFKNHIALLFMPVDTVDPTGKLVSISRHTRPEIRQNESVIQWPQLVLQMSVYPIWVVFLFYFPAILCIFSTVVAEERGIRMLILDGPSLMGFRGCVSKVFFTVKSYSEFFAFYYIVVCFFVTLLVVVFSAESLLTPSLNVDNYLTNTYLSCYSVFALRSLSVCFIPALSFTRPCLVCHFAGVRHIRNFSCQREIRQHLRVQPLIFMQFLELFSRTFLTYCSAIELVRPSCKAFYVRYPVQLFKILVCLVTLLPVILLITAVCILLCLVALFCSSPSVTFFDLAIEAMKCRNNLILRVLFAVSVSLGFPIMLTIYCDLIVARLAINTVGAIRVLVMNLNESLPYVACSVLVLYYLWSCYSAFTSKYQNLGLTLYKHYKTDHGHLHCSNPILQ